MQFATQSTYRVLRISTELVQYSAVVLATMGFDTRENLAIRFFGLRMWWHRRLDKSHPSKCDD